MLKVKKYICSSITCKIKSKKINTDWLIVIEYQLVSQKQKISASNFKTVPI